MSIVWRAMGGMRVLEWALGHRVVVHGATIRSTLPREHLVLAQKMITDLKAQAVKPTT